MKMTADVAFRPARAGDGQALFDITRLSVGGLARESYTPEQIAGWMGERTPSFYEELIGKGQMIVAERDGGVAGFVDAEPGEVTRLFILPDAAGLGLGKRLLEIGIARAGAGHAGPIRVESTINAEGFYRRHGFRPVGKGYFSHGLGGAPIEVVYMELS
jgi:GNAT superfamily N-acetyltransferase